LLVGFGKKKKVSWVGQWPLVCADLKTKSTKQWCV
jgi:hypothetical protein